MSVKISYFVHGTTTDNEQGLATGWLPGKLSAKGLEQSKMLSEQVTNKQFDIVFCSDLQRAIDSAELSFGDKYKIKQDARLRECNYGDMNGTSAKTFKNNMHDFVDKPFPNGESYNDVETRLTNFINYLKENYNDNHTASPPSTSTCS